IQDPEKEKPNIIPTRCTKRNVNDVEETVRKSFTSHARFSHPLCRANSRNEIPGPFQWYRLAGP
ncbi:hypothetical protein HD554DRAFT_2007024, partial [Boletus coccyginus]